MSRAWTVEYLNADQDRPHIPARARVAKVRRPRRKPSSDRMAVGE